MSLISLRKSAMGGRSLLDHPRVHSPRPAGLGFSRAAKPPFVVFFHFKVSKQFRLAFHFRALSSTIAGSVTSVWEMSKWSAANRPRRVYESVCVCVWMEDAVMFVRWAPSWEEEEEEFTDVHSLFATRRAKPILSTSMIYFTCSSGMQEGAEKIIHYRYYWI